MSKKNIHLIQKILIFVILILLCVILVLLFLSKKQPQALQEANLTPTPTPLKVEIYENQDAVFKPFEPNLSKSESPKTPPQINENNLSQNEANLSFFDSNESLSVEENVSKDANLSLLGEANLSKQNQNLTLKEENLSKNENVKLNLAKGQRAKLAIIIDDMANDEQVKSLKALKLKLNPSFFPSHTLHPNTPKLAKKFEFYMVHLPLKALTFQNKMPVLNPNDSEALIEQNILKIKKEFKGLKFINNHTGSLFTSDEEAMRKLYKILYKHGLVFVDSKTIHHSKAPKIAKEMRKTYIQRDVFLDNEDDVAYVKKQLLSAIKLAQKRGYAIAIGHPRKNTFKALQESKEVLESVELVYLSELYNE